METDELNCMIITIPTCGWARKHTCNKGKNKLLKLPVLVNDGRGKMKCGTGRHAVENSV